MADIKLVINITKHEWEYLNKLVKNGDQLGHYERLLVNGIPLDDIDSDETRAYFDGQAYGWEQGRKALIDDVKAEIQASMYCDKDTRLVENANASGLKKALEIIDKHISGEEDKDE